MKKLLFIIVSILLLSFANANANTNTNKKEVIVPNTPESIRPLSKAIEYNNLIFLSGQIGSDMKTGKMANGIESQTKQILDNISIILESSNSNMDKILKVNIFVKNINDFDVVNKIYATYFKKPYPARTFIEISKLPLDALIEIEVVAYK